MVPALGKNEVHVWWTRLNEAVPRYAVAEVLSTDERARLQRLASSALQHAWSHSRAWLRHIIGRYSGVAPQAVAIAYTPTEKPFLSDRADLRFNLAHSGELTVLAVANDCDVGVDVEVIQPRRNLDVLIADYFSPQERARMRALEPHQRLTAFLTCWTCKEAYLKGLGFGLSQEPSSITVSLPPDEPARLIATPATPEHATEWSLTPLELCSGYIATLATHGPRPHVRVFAD